MSFNILTWLKERKKKSKPYWQDTRLQEPNQPMNSRSVHSNPWHEIEPEQAVLVEYKNVSEDKRIEAKPKDVLSELFCRDEDFKIDLTDLKSKIKAMEKRRDFMKVELNQSTTEEDKAIVWLKCRLKYIKMKERFNWPVTTDEKISELCKKYKLQGGSVGGYKRCIPAEALDAMEAYVQLYKKVADIQPLEIKLLVDEGGAEHKKDPIIYAASPFGNYYYVLGAWDESVAILDELFLRK